MNNNINKTYGKNFSLNLFNKKIIIGLKRDFIVFISFLFFFILMYVFNIYSYKSFYNKYFLIFISIIFFIMLYNFILCFLIEPGIVPRNYNNFSIENHINNILNNNNDSLNNINNDNNIIINSNVNNSDKIQIDYEKKDMEKIFDNINNNKITNNNININNKIEVDCENKAYEKDLISNKNNLNSDEKSKFLNYITLKDDIPYIFQKKPCTTCNIIRPETCSHCGICDNCIIGMDHHCYYISNCVGIRNHKNFYLFLSFGSLISLIGIVISFYHFIYVLFVYDFNLTVRLYNNYILFFYLSIFIWIFIPLFLYKILLVKNKNFLLILCSIGNLIFNIIFFLNKKNYQKENKNIIIKNYYHPFSSLLLEGIFYILFTVLNMFKKETKLIGIGLTIKQYNSIYKQKKELSMKGNNNYIFMNDYLERKFEIKNIINFLCKKQPKSLINI